MLYLAMFKSHNQYFIECSEDKNIKFFASEEKGLSYFTDGYNLYHKQNDLFSVQACLHWMMFAPRIVRISSLDEIIDKVIITETARVSIYQSVAGEILGVSCKGHLTEKLYNSGKTPELLNQSTFN